MNKRKVRNIPLGECWWCKRITNMDEIKKNNGAASRAKQRLFRSITPPNDGAAE